MNSVLKAAIFNPQSYFIHLRAALFHSTPVLERRRRNHWQSYRSHQNFNSYSKRFRKIQSKKTLLRNISAYADYLIQRWQDEINDGEPLSSRGTSWFKKDYFGRSKKAQNQRRHCSNRRGFTFCDDEVEDEVEIDVERVFEPIFGRKRHGHWSFVNEENSRCRGSYSYGFNYWNCHNWRFRIEEDYESSAELESSDLDTALHRQALGLSASGPLRLEDVKTAYRASALKWHPDRHQGSSKAVAEEKFKLCSAAYQTLCDKLAVD